MFVSPDEYAILRYESQNESTTSRIREMMTISMWHHDTHSETEEEEEEEERGWASS